MAARKTLGYDANEMAREAFVNVNVEVRGKTHILEDSYFQTQMQSVNYSEVTRIHHNQPLWIAADSGMKPQAQACLNGASLPRAHMKIIDALSNTGTLVSDLNNTRYGVLPPTVDRVYELITSKQSDLNELIRRSLMTHIRPIGTVFADGLGHKRYDEAGRVDVMSNRDQIALMVSGTTSVNVMTPTELQNERKVELVVPVKNEWSNWQTWKAEDEDHVRGQITCYFRHDESQGLGCDLEAGFVEYNRYENSLFDRLCNTASEEEIRAAPPVLTTAAAMSNFIAAIAIESLRLFISSGMARVNTSTASRAFALNSSPAGIWSIDRTIRWSPPANPEIFDADVASAHAAGTLSMHGAPNLITIAPIICKPEFRTFSPRIDSLNVMTQLCKAFRLAGRSEPLPKMTPELTANGRSVGTISEKKAAFLFMREIIVGLTSNPKSNKSNKRRVKLHRFGTRVEADGTLSNSDFYQTPDHEFIPDHAADVIGTGNAAYELLPQLYQSIEMFFAQISGGARIKAIQPAVLDLVEILARF